MKVDSHSEQLNKIAKLKEQIEKLESELHSQKVSNTEVQQEEDKGMIKIFHTWKSPARFFVKRDRGWFVKVALVAILLILLAAFLDESLIIIAIASVLMVSFLLATVPPNDVMHKVTSEGIRSIDTFIKWMNMSDFWVAEKYGQKAIYIETNLRFPTRLTMLVNDNKIYDIAKTLSRYLDYKQLDNNKQGWLSKIADGEYLPPEKLHLVVDLSESSSSKEH